MHISAPVCVIISRPGARRIVCVIGGAPGDDIAAGQPVAEIGIGAALRAEGAVFRRHRLLSAAGAEGLAGFGRGRFAHASGNTSGTGRA